MMVLLVILFGLATYEFSRVKYVGNVRACALIGCLIYLLNQIESFNFNPNIMYGATFVGMSCINKLNRIQVILAAVLYYLAYNLLIQYFAGFGGLLGLSAFMGVVVVYFFPKYLVLISGSFRSKFDL